MNEQALDLEKFLPYQLSVLSNTISAAIAETYSSRYGLSISEWRVLAVLGRFPGSSGYDSSRLSPGFRVAAAGC